MAAPYDRGQPFPPAYKGSRGRHALIAFAFGALLVLTQACGSTSVSTDSPSAIKCPVNVTSSMQSAPASGASGTLTIATNRDCTWAVSSGAQWIVITSPSNGQGDGSATYRVAANTDVASRRGVLEVNNTQVAVTQDAACRYDVAGPTSTVPAQGGSATINVQSSGTCGWTAVSQTGWISVSAGSSGTGNGAVTLTVATNNGGQRSGTVLVGGQTITIVQGAAAAEPPPPPPPPTCDLSITPTSQTLSADSGSGTVSVSVGSGCAWTAVSTAAWITITSGASGSGPGQVRFSVAANPATTSRQGTLTIGGRTFTLIQAAVSCTYTVQPASTNIGAAATSITITITTPAACAWNAHANAPWLTVAGGGSGTGSGMVTVNVAENTGDGRSGTVSVADQTVMISQAAAPCSYSIAPPSAAFTAAPGTGSVAVTAGNNCAWTAVSNAAWITVTSGATGSGVGTVGYSVAANTGAARNGAITIAGRTFTVTQAAMACSYSIAPTTANVPTTGGPGSVTVTTTGDCAWTAVANVSWITITRGASGTGNGPVEYTVAANADPAERTGTLTIADKTFTVTQAAVPVPCSFSIAPPSAAFTAAAGTGSVAVTAGNNCAWTAAANVPWITITSGASGTGNGTVQYTVAANADPAERTGTLTIADKTFTITQAVQTPTNVVAIVQRFDGKLKARYSPEYGPPLTATTMNWRPFTRYVIGDPLWPAGI